MSSNKENPLNTKSDFIIKDHKIVDLLSEIWNTTNPVRFYFNIGTVLNEISTAIEDTSIAVENGIITQKNAGVKEAMIYSILGGKEDISDRLIRDKKLKSDKEWNRLNLKYGILSVFPNYDQLSLIEKQKAVLQFYGKIDTTSKLSNLELLESDNGCRFDLKNSIKKRIIEENRITLEDAISDLISFRHFIKANPLKAEQRHALKFLFFKILGIGEDESRQPSFFIKTFSSEIENYVDILVENKLNEEVKYLKSNLEKKFHEAERNSEYYDKLLLLKKNILNISGSVFSFIFFPFLINKLAKKLDKNKQSCLDVSEFILGNHFAKNYEEYFEIKNFFKSLNRAIAGQSKNKYILVGMILSFAYFFLPVFFTICFLLLILIETLKRNHKIREFTLGYHFGVSTFVYLFVSLGFFFSFSYTKNDFYSILYENNIVSVNTLFLESGYQYWKTGWYQFSKANIYENSYSGTYYENNFNNYEKCKSFNYFKEKKSCIN